MHPYYQHEFARLQMNERMLHADRRRHIRQLPRPPSRVRRSLASMLIRLATRLAEEPAIAAPRRA